MKDKIYKMIAVEEETHYQFSIEREKMRTKDGVISQDKFINHLLALHRQEQVKNFKK
jgi:hypothetical protein